MFFLRDSWFFHFFTKIFLSFLSPGFSLLNFVIYLFLAYTIQSSMIILFALVTVRHQAS